MMLDSDLRDFMAKQSGEAHKPFQEQTISELRKWHLQSSLRVSGTPIDGVDTRDLTFNSGEAIIPLRIYRPLSAGTRKLPVLIFFHGGGFILGSIKTHDSVPRRIAQQCGISVISVEYRLAPEHKAPAALLDAVSSLNWIRDHSSELNVDPDHLAVGGDSAGGNLAAVLAIVAKQNSIPVCCQVLIYPVTDVRPSSMEYPSRNGESPGLTKDELQYMIDQYLVNDEQAYDWRISPIVASLKGVAPALVITALNDVLYDDGELYANKLVADGVPVLRRNFPGMIHGFIKMNFIEAASAAFRTIQFFLDEFSMKS